MSTPEHNEEIAAPEDIVTPVVNLNVIRAAVNTPARRLPDGRWQWGLLTVTWGPPGVGKTECIKELARYLGFDYVFSMSAANKGPHTFEGVMFPTEHFYRNLPPEWAYMANQAKRALIVIDEIGDCARATQAALQDMLTERRIGGMEFGPNVRFILLGNPPEISTNPTDMSMPNANRLAHLMAGDPNQHRNLEKWHRWLLAEGGDQVARDPIDADEEEAKVLKEWPKQYAKARGIIAAFTSPKGPMQGKVFEMPEPEDPRASRGWASNRSMANAARALASSWIHKLNGIELHDFIAGFVGQGIATELTTYLDRCTLPDLEEVLDKKTKWAYDPARPDIAAHILEGGASLVSNRECPNRKARVEYLWSLIDKVQVTEPDVVFMAVEVLSENKLTNFKTARNVLNKLGPLMQAAKLAS